MSLCLTGIFLPYRSHFNFFIPLLDFLPRLSLPPSHPRSIHPCLRDACHLAACSVLGGRWSHLEPYFAERTRHFLNAALMLVNLEHMTQFLWASVILASYFTRVRRVQESYAIISPASHLVAACGLLSTHDPGLEHGYRADQFLLPAPKTEVEALERIWLAQSVFITDRSLHMLIGYPGTFPCDKRCIPSLDKTEITYPSFKPKMTTEKELMKMWQSDVYRAASVMHLFSLVTTFAEFTHSGKTTRDQMDITLIQSFIQFHDATIPSFLGRANSSPSTVLLPHTTLYGGAAIFYSLFPRNDARARGEMIRFVEKLVEICKQVLEHTQPHFVHMMNAIRILAHELRNSDVQANPTLAAEYCHFIEILLEFIDDMMGFYPAWGDSTELVKGVINLALESLHNKSEDHTIAGSYCVLPIL
ncbi:hypothetical protein DL93DRAFT_2171975 [Clavulina sp. PMI_390]|nr:hypothetical protein DL93DRAFT_2171975 [Clavulina sp. PMI_390]